MSLCRVICAAPARRRPAGTASRHCRGCLADPGLGHRRRCFACSRRPTGRPQQAGTSARAGLPPSAFPGAVLRGWAGLRHMQRWPSRRLRRKTAEKARGSEPELAVGPSGGAAGLGGQSLEGGPSDPHPPVAQDGSGPAGSSGRRPRVGGEAGRGRSVPAVLDPVPDGPLLPRAALHHQPQPEVGVFGHLHLQAPARVPAHDGAALRGGDAESARAPGAAGRPSRGCGTQAHAVSHSHLRRGPVRPSVLPGPPSAVPPAPPAPRGLRSDWDNGVQGPEMHIAPCSPACESSVLGRPCPGPLGTPGPFRLPPAASPVPGAPVSWACSSVCPGRRLLPCQELGCGGRSGAGSVGSALPPAERTPGTERSHPLPRSWAQSPSCTLRVHVLFTPKGPGRVPWEEGSELQEELGVQGRAHPSGVDL